MRKKLFPFLLIFFLLASSAAATFTGFGSTPENAQPNVQAFALQNRVASYVPENRTLDPYVPTSTSPQQVTASNDPLVEKMQSFNLTYRNENITIELPSNEAFLAIDGASQSFVLNVYYTIQSPNDSVVYSSVTNATTVGTGHFFTTNPPAGTWKINATLLQTGETTSWIQAFSEHYGTKFVTEIEKEQLHLVAGQNKYYKVALNAGDWFYLYANKYGGDSVGLDIRKATSYGTIFRTYSNYVSQLYSPGATYSTGEYLVQVSNRGSTDIFVEIVKPSGIQTELNVDSGIHVLSRFGVDLEFFKSTLYVGYDWVSFDGAMDSTNFNVGIGPNMTARYLIINPNLSIIFDDTSTSEVDFISDFVPNYVPGTYYVGVFTNQAANATMKITTSSAVPPTGFVKLDQNVTFSETGQSYYLKIPQNQNYFMFAEYSKGPQRCATYTILSPSWSVVWGFQSNGTYGVFAPSKSVYQFYLIRMQGQGGSSSIIHARFQGMEDNSLQTPDSTNYISRFPGDFIVSNITVRNSNYLLQHVGNMNGSSFIGLYDTTLTAKISNNFTSQRQDYYQRWRKGYENPSQGNWLQVYLDIEPSITYLNLSATEVNTLQSGDESQSFATPLQLSQTNPYPNSWNVETYTVHMDSVNWFGIVSQMFSLNSTYTYHPYLSIWVYDPLLTELDRSQALNSTHTFDTNFWPNAHIGDWTIVVVGYQDSLNRDPLNCTVSFVGNLDFKRDWPADLNGTVSSFSVTVASQTSTVEVLSGSSVSNFTFNPVTRRIAFDTFGAGTNDFCVVTVPVVVAPRPFEVTVDNQPSADVLSQQNATCTLIYVPFEDPNHHVIVQPSVYAQATPTPSPTQTPTATPNPTPTPTPAASPTTSTGPSTNPTPTNTPTSNPTSSTSPSTSPATSSTPTANPSNPTQSPSTQPEPTPALPEMTTVLVLALIAAATVVAVILKKTSHFGQRNQPQ
jgi:hypothetical protein